MWALENSTALMWRDCWVMIKMVGTVYDACTLSNGCRLAFGFAEVILGLFGKGWGCTWELEKEIVVSSRRDVWGEVWWSEDLLVW